jgi:hypothetical protein
VGALGLSKAAHSQDLSVVDRPVAPGLRLLGTRLEYQSPSRLIAHLLWFNQVEQRSPVALRLRLLSPTGAPLAELTEFPFYGFEPPSLWTANEIVTDAHLLNLLAPLSPGDYSLELGLADSPESVRVPVRLGRPDQPDPHTSAIVQPTDVTFGGQIQLTGHGLETLTRQPLRLSELAEPLDCRRSVAPGTLVRLQLDWTAVARLSADYTVFTHLENQSGDRVFGQDMQPERDLAPTSSWLPGQSIRERRIWRLPNDLAPGLHSIRVGLYQPSATGGIVPLPVDGGAPSVVLDRLKVGPTPARPAVPRLSGQRFGDALTLLGYDQLAPTSEGLEVPLFWRAEQPLAVAYTGFVHVVDAAGRLVAQQDQPIGLGQSPTDCWAAGEEVADRVVVRFAEPLPTGKYTVYLGVYDPATLKRLPLQGSPGDAHALFTFELP